MVSKNFEKTQINVNFILLPILPSCYNNLEYTLIRISSTTNNYNRISNAPILK